MKGNFVNIKNMWKEQIFKLKVWDFWLWLSESENFSGHSRNGPLDTSRSKIQARRAVLHPAFLIVTRGARIKAYGRKREDKFINLFYSNYGE